MYFPTQFAICLFGQGSGPAVTGLTRSSIVHSNVSAANGNKINNYIHILLIQ